MCAHKNNNCARLQELLARYREGDLLDEERLEIEEILANSPDKERMLWEDSVAYHADSFPPTTTEDALARLDLANEVKKEGGIWPLFFPWVKTLLVPGGGILLAVVVWFGVNSLKETSGISSAVGSSVVSQDRPFILVSFNETTSIKEITNILQGLGLDISSGPLFDGVYRVVIPVMTGSEYDAITAALEQEESVNWLVSGRRPKDE